MLDAVRRGGASPSPSHPAAERWLQKREATAAQASARQQRREECLRCSTQYGVAAGCKLTISKNGRCIKVGPPLLLVSCRSLACLVSSSLSAHVLPCLVPAYCYSEVVFPVDNKAAIDSSYNPENHSRSRHIERKHYF